jgi:hypothetical protein
MATLTPSGERARTGSDVPALAWLLAAINVACAAIHFAVILEHSDGALIVPLGFAAAGWFQLAVAGALVLRKPTPFVYGAALLGNLAIIVVWIFSRTAGLPWAPYNGVAEDVGTLDLVATSLEAAAVVLALYLLLAPSKAWSMQAPALIVGVAAITLATVALVSPHEDHHGNAATTVSAAGGHSHGGSSGATATTGDDHAAEMLRIDRARCDWGFNPASYWDEALQMNVDTHMGGKMAEAHAPDPASDAAAPLAFDGRGSEQLDRLVSLTSQSGGEGAAARLIVELANSDDETYSAWRQWMANNASAGHGHDAPADAEGGDAGVPTMGHAGPQTWQAMLDPRLCDELRDELDLARETALKYPTVADVTKAGWTRVTPYVPGIAAHYMNFGMVDGEFDIEEPEMILYDGSEPDSRVIGLSYYTRLDGTQPPTQGFVGPNDLTHRHFGLCVNNTGVIGDSTTTDEECKRMGGAKLSGFDGWMMHAWVVPGCESPWGVFSAVNPLLDRDLGEASGTNDGGCSASGVRDRYALSAGTSDLTSPSDDPVGLAGG